jgi:phosphate transport system protein
MERHFIKELDDLKMTLLNMAALTRRAFEKATQAYLNRDETLAQTVIAGDREINNLELKIDQIVLKLLALEQPMARDLRFILGATKISKELERIADQAVNISERTLFLCQRPPLDHIPAMEQLIKVAGDMLDAAIASLVEDDTQKAIKLRQMDDIADKHTLEVLQTLIDNMVKSTPGAEKRILNTQRSVQTIIISRCLERVGDLATNIGEHVAFIVSAINIKHQKIDFDK